MTPNTPATRLYTRLYIVTGSGAPAPRLVEATSPAQALRHVARDVFRVAIAGSLDVARLMREGVDVEQAGHDPSTTEQAL